MTLTLILLAAIIGVGALLWAEHRIHLHRHSNSPADLTDESPDRTDGEAEEDCCGMHVTCERDSLLASVSKEIEYYDDEELDRFAGREPESYTGDECEEFRDILLSMQPDDIAGWARSLQLRHISLPTDVRDELIMIVAEARQAKSHKNTV